MAAESEIGLALGLAWTEVGGEVLQIEATLTNGRGGVTLTGKLGEVMQESAQAALTCIKSRAERLGMNLEFIRKRDLHIHIPEGAIPKDGPSAGVTLATAMASALTRVPVRSDVAMTGEITLRGRVLPVGGVKEKLLAAHRVGVSTVLLPKDNEKDLEEVPEEVRADMTIQFVETIDEVLSLALEDACPTDRGRDRRRSASARLDDRAALGRRRADARRLTLAGISNTETQRHGLKTLSIKPCLCVSVSLC